MEVIVGRKGEQPFVISDKTVSGKHLRLIPLQDGNVQVEDLGSTNGTFVDDVRIIKKAVAPDTIVRMGSSFTFRVSDALLANNHVPSTPVVAPVAKPEYDPEILVQFQRLENIWNNYQQEKISLQRSNASKGYLRMLPMLVIGALGYLISCVPELVEFRTVITLTGLGIGVALTWISYKSATSLPEQMERLNQQFQIDYVCPKCKQFLGFVPYENLKNRGQCSACKTKWIQK